MKRHEMALGSLLLVVITLALGYLTAAPAYEVLAKDQTELKFVVRHSGQRLGICQVSGAVELAKLAPNMRQLEVCPSEKSPMEVELRLNDQVRFSGQIIPSGIHNDGVIALYRRFAVDVGPIDVRLRLKNDVREDAFSHDFHQTINAGPDSIVVLQVNDSGIRVYQPGLSPVS